MKRGSTDRCRMVSVDPEIRARRGEMANRSRASRASVLNIGRVERCLWKTSVRDRRHWTDVLACASTGGYRGSCRSARRVDMGSKEGGIKRIALGG